MFKRRLTLFTFAGIKIGIDLSWLFIAILLSWTLASYQFPLLYPNLSTGSYWLMGVLGMLGLFSCIVLHELGHALVAKHYKIPTEQITLFLFGGVAEIKKEPESPKVEFWIAIAGPIVSLILSFTMYLINLLGHHQGWGPILLGLTGYLAMINLFIVFFNLIPAFPLDGGRIFRAALWAYKKNLAFATKVSTSIGKGFGLALIFFGLFSLIGGNMLSGLWLAILGLFIQSAASSSQAQFYIKKDLEGEKAGKFMKKKPETVPSQISIQEFLDDHVYHSYHHLYPVTQEKSLLGYISLQEVKSLPKEEWKTTSVSKIMIPKNSFQTISDQTSALEALNLMQQSGASTLLVTKEDELIGLLTPNDLLKHISLKLELEEDSCL